MQEAADSGELIIKASLGRHLAFAPVAFAVTEGESHSVVYSNKVFQGLQSAGEIRIGASANGADSATDLTPLLDQVFRNAETVRDAIIQSPGQDDPAWSCTIWPVTGSDNVVQTLVIEVRDVELIEGTKARQRAITEQLLLTALREQDVAREAVSSNDRAQYLAKASRDLSMSLDEETTRDSVRHLTLPRPGAWCIVDVVESNGAIQRLAVVHPDPSKQELSRKLEQQWPPRKEANPGTRTVESMLRPTVVTHESGAALMLAAHGEDNLRVLRQIGFGSLLVVPLVVRARVQGAMTFVTPAGDPAFTSQEISLAVEIASRCAMALDNARLYREADALRLAAEMANQSKSQFLGSMSHELRTPLNAIGGFTELIEMGLRGPVTEEQHVALARIKANQEHLLTLISEILNFVRIESGRMEYRIVEVSMSQALYDTASMLSGAIAEKGLTVAIPECTVNDMAWGDADRIRQILVNLVMNAVKYSAQNGGTITLSCMVDGDVVRAEVADTGYGIPAEKLDSIFEPFVQLTSGLTERAGGVGLGLAISRDLARAMGGELAVESTVGVGSKFILTLPIAGSANGQKKHKWDGQANM